MLKCLFCSYLCAYCCTFYLSNRYLYNMFIQSCIPSYVTCTNVEIAIFFKSFRFIEKSARHNKIRAYLPSTYMWVGIYMFFKKQGDVLIFFYNKKDYNGGSVKTCIFFLHFAECILPVPLNSFFYENIWQH